MNQCENKVLNNWCNNQDIKLVQLRSQVAGNNNANEFKGDKLLMCKECRKVNIGGFKIISGADK